MAGPMSAIIDYYGSLSAASFPGGVRPPVYFSGVPLTTTGGANTALPWVDLIHKGTPNRVDMLGNPIYDCRFELRIYYEKLQDVEAAALAVRYNGQAPTAFAGFEMAAAIPMTGYTYLPYSCVQDGDEVEAREPVQSRDNKFVHRTYLPFRFQYQLVGAYPTTTTVAPTTTTTVAP